MYKRNDLRTAIVVLAFFVLVLPGLMSTGTAQESEPTIAEKARESINKGLDWLRTRQAEDGSWMGDVGVTAFAVTAFANGGIGEDDPAVKKAVDFILSKRTPDGSFTMGTNHVYYTSICTVALASTRDPDHKEEVEDAIRWLESVQKNKDNSKEDWWVGGVGYGGDGRPDLSNNQFAVMAFDAASTVYGIEIEESTWENIEIFTTRCQNLKAVNPNWASYDDGGFMYFPGYSHAGDGVSYGSMTAAGIWSYILSGVDKDDSRVQAAVKWLDDHRTFTENPGIGQPGLYYYYWTYARAVTLYGKPIGDWYGDLISAVIERQDSAGSWVNSESDWWWENMPELATTYAILSLEAPLLPWAEGVTLEIELHSKKNLHVLDEEGRHSGDGVLTRSSSYEEGITNSKVTKGEDITRVVVENAAAGIYTVGMTGGGESWYELKITVKKDGEELVKKQISGDAPEDVESDLVLNSVSGPGGIYLESPAAGETISSDNFEISEERGGETEETSYTPLILGAIGVLVLLILLSLVLLKRKG